MGRDGGRHRDRSFSGTQAAGRQPQFYDPALFGDSCVSGQSRIPRTDGARPARRRPARGLRKSILDRLERRRIESSEWDQGDLSRAENYRSLIKTGITTCEPVNMVRRIVGAPHSYPHFHIARRSVAAVDPLRSYGPCDPSTFRDWRKHNILQENISAIGDTPSFVGPIENQSLEAEHEKGGYSNTDESTCKSYKIAFVFGVLAISF